MRGAMSPIQQRLMSRMPQPQSRMPVMDPGMMDPAMAMNPGDVGIDMPPGQGDMGMETMYPEPGPAQAFPVHSREEVSREYQRMGKNVPAPMQQITGAYEGAPQGPLRSKLHAAQHQMMGADQNNVNQMKRMELAGKKAELEAKIMALKKAGNLDAAARLQQMLQTLSTGIDAAIGAVPE